MAGDEGTPRRVEQKSQPVVMSWPVDPETGEPMAIVTSNAQELAPTVQFGNVTLGPTGSMVPCRNDPETIRETMIERQRDAQFVIGGERRLLAWALDPSLKVSHPSTGQQYPGHEEAAPATTEPPSQASEPGGASAPSGS